jgi:hypothetical protein
MAGSNTMNYAFFIVAPGRGRIYTVNTNAGGGDIDDTIMKIIRPMVSLK